jgi:regulation of enolase protein 1 (concanavalin A-like superfamily)
MKIKYAAVALKTESGDDYLYLEQYEFVTEIPELLHKKLSEEFAYVYSVQVETNYKPDAQPIKQLVLEKIYQLS